MKRIKIKDIAPFCIGTSLTVCGWVRTSRQQKNFAFIELNDGSTLSSLQIIADEALPDYQEIISQICTGASLKVTGTLVESPGHKQKWELKAEKIDIFGTCLAEDYPLQKKRHSFEFLRTIAHLRPRTNTQGAVLRVRNALAFATHLFFQGRGFQYIQTPIITASDAEGGGQQFTVTALDLNKPPRLSDGKMDFSKDFFHRPAFLTVSGQLNAESLACALSDVYTFGPTFRAENSNTSRHLAEFWMIEPEIAFADLKDDMECAESYLKFLIDYILKHCREDMEFFDAFIEKGIIERLTAVTSSSFAHLTYTQAIDILKKSGRSFEFPIEWGTDLQSEHERYLAEDYCKKPVILTDYPQKIKAFYMRSNDDGKTVAAMDVLVPKIGEIIGGSQREERLDVLEKKIQDFGLHKEDYWWYLQLRQYGTVPHAGFGAGFERLVLFATGLENIRDAIPFPRFPGHADF
ncbi:MAG TPA: asparagine--tRNA ligase [Rhabdochlamydiaceae bacterium]|nr:asparagine--tRNA ligase [Rhabdochlamydiaceae bacterium]